MFPEHTVDPFPHVGGQVVQVNILFPQVTFNIGRVWSHLSLSFWTFIVHYVDDLSRVSERMTQYHPLWQGAVLRGRIDYGERLQREKIRHPMGHGDYSAVRLPVVSL
jgi:hypothetical protein